MLKLKVVSLWLLHSQIIYFYLDLDIWEASSRSWVTRCGPHLTTIQIVRYKELVERQKVKEVKLIKVEEVEE